MIKKIFLFLATWACVFLTFSIPFLFINLMIMYCWFCWGRNLGIVQWGQDGNLFNPFHWWGILGWGLFSLIFTIPYYILLFNEKVQKYFKSIKG